MTASHDRASVESVLARHEKQILRLEANPCDSGVLPRNVADAGWAISGSLASSITLTVDFNDIDCGDGILISALAPSLPVALGTEGFPVSCTDSAGNSYSVLLTRDYQHSPAQVNTGAYTVLFFCESSIAALTQGVSTITVTWSSPVYDRFIWAWLVRHSGGAHTPTVLGSIASNDMAVYGAAGQSVSMPVWTPDRDNSLAFAIVLFVGSWSSFSSAVNGFFQAKWDNYFGSKQSYLFIVQTYGADVYIVVPSGSGSEEEIDLGSLVGGTPTPAGKICNQTYGTGANHWKGIRMLGIH